jgi:hypothetical protein
MRSRRASHGGVRPLNCGVRRQKMRSDQVRAYSALAYGDLRGFLLNLRELEPRIASSGLDRSVRTLRTNNLKPWRELREAALFAHFMSERVGTSVRIAKGEEQDYDCIATWESEGVRRFSPVQIKEVVPEYLNPSADIDGVIASLAKYVSSPDLTVAIHLNKRIDFDLSTIRVPKLSIAALWMFGAISPDSSRWGLWGDLLAEPVGTEHAYPVA